MQALPQIDYSRHPGYQFEPDPELGRQAAEHLEPLIARMREAEAERTARFGYRYGAVGDDGRRLVEDGALAFELGPASARRLVELAEPAVAAVHARMAALKAAGKRANFLDRMEMATPQAHGALRDAIEQAMRELGAFELTAAYFSARAAKFENAGVLISTPEDKESLLRHSGDAPGAGLHVDSSGKCLIKAVLYLADVGVDTGPFGLATGSHLWDPGCEERIFRRAFDRSELKGRAAGSRRAFVSLPKPMQVKAEFGADLLPDWEDTHALLQSEQLFLGGPGTGALFDPEAVHRGGLVLQGERRAILVTLSAIW